VKRIDAVTIVVWVALAIAVLWLVSEVVR